MYSSIKYVCRHILETLFFFHSHIFLYFISLWSFGSFVASQKLRKRILCVLFVSKYTCLCMKNIFGHPATISPRSFSYASNAMKQLYERRTLSYMISFIFPFFRLLPFPFLHSFLPFIYLFFSFLLLLLLCSLNESRYHLFFLHFIMHTLVISTVSISINRLDCINKPKFTIRK